MMCTLLYIGKWSRIEFITDENALKATMTTYNKKDDSLDMVLKGWNYIASQ